MRGIKNQKLIKIARNLRKTRNPWEEKLWYYLRGRRFKNFKFRRQYPVANYVVDFCCLNKGVVIELDGSQHQNSLTDKQRTKKIANLGFKVLRFWNSDLNNNFQGVMDAIADSLLSKPPHPSSLSLEGEGQIWQ